MMATFTSYCISEAIKRGAKVIEVTPEAEAAWVKEIMDSTLESTEFRSSCT